MNNAPRQADLENIKEIIKRTDLCMLTSIGENGIPHTRPMSNNQEVEFDGDLWFFTYGNTHKALEIADNNGVSVAFSDPGNSAFVVVTGRAVLVRDRQKIEELWRPHMKAWFPEGTSEPDIALIKVHAALAEIWQGPSNFITRAWHFGKALVTGNQYEGQNYTVRL